MRLPTFFLDLKTFLNEQVIDLILEIPLDEDLVIFYSSSNTTFVLQQFAQLFQIIL